MTKISIIIRAKNEEKWLKACLLAIKKQHYDNFEIILIDNQSTDKTVEIAKLFGVSKVVEIDKYNPSNALNEGVSVAEGNICVFLSAHCVPKNELWLEELVLPIINREVNCSYGRQIPTSQSNPDNSRDLLMTFGKEKIVQHSDIRFHNANSAIKSELIKTYPFDESLTNVEDWHWAAQIVKLGEKIAYIPSASVYHHHGINQHSDEQVSFRALPVSKLLNSAYEQDHENEFFFDKDCWDGLVILSKCSVDKFREVVSDLNELYMISDTELIGDESVSVINHSPHESLDFLGYLQEMLNKAEKKYEKIFDYIVFLDFSYQTLDSKVVQKNVSELFHYWADVASVARRIKGKFLEFDDKLACINSSYFPTKGSNVSKVELNLGYCGAFRTSALRTKKKNNLNYRITKIINHSEAFKL